jgi:hypothetical protein
MHKRDRETREINEIREGPGEHAFPVVVRERMVGQVCPEDARKLPREFWDTTPVHSEFAA